MRRAITAFLIVMSLGLAPHGFAADTRTITHIAGDLYRFQNNFHNSVFLVTADGVIATDPINADAAKWLQTEIKKRFNKKIKYLIYSHDHRDHIAGGEVFDDSVVIVAHENAKSDIIAEQRPTAIPAVTFSDRMTIELGGKQVELIYPGRSHSDNLIALYFPAERALFAVDFISVNRLPYKGLGDAYFPEWIDTIKRVEQIDFDILLPGHGPVGTKADAVEHRRYLELLYREVLAATRAGKSLEEMKQAIRLDAFKHFGMYDQWRELNIEGVYKQVSLHRRGN